MANGKLRQSGLFETIHVPSVPGDHGAALGAALWASREAVVGRTRASRLPAYLGPAYDAHEIEQALRAAAGIVWTRPGNIAVEVARLLADGRILAWFQGRSEYGPRALGNRSILADPRRQEMKDLVNERIKHREPYRPFAGAVPMEGAPRYFDLEGASPFMQFVVPIRESARHLIPAVSHGGTCRVQTVDSKENPAFHELLVEFGKLTGIPILLNTSFNDADEPIVCSPADALRTFLGTDLDALAFGPFLVNRLGKVDIRRVR